MVRRLFPAFAAFLLFVPASHANLSAEINRYGPALCGNNTGYAIADAFGGLPPYSYLWSTGATTDTITGLAPGNYNVTVTDANSDQAVAYVSIWNDPAPLITYLAPAAGLHGCHGLCNNGLWYHEELMPMNLTPPFTFNPEPVYGLNELQPDLGAWTGLCDGLTLFTTVTDAFGCVAQLQTDEFMVHGSDPGPMSVVGTQPSCDAMSSGVMTVNVGLAINDAYTPIWATTLLDENMEPVPGVYIGAMPMLGQNITTLPGRSPGNYYIERRFANETGDCTDLLPVTIPSLGADCGVVNGSAFLDYNENCLLNGGEPAVPSGIIEVLPGPYYTTISGNGDYLLSLPSGDYTLTQQSASVQEHCTGGPIPFTIAAGGTVQRQLPDTSVVALDLETMITSGPARPGFEFQCGAIIHNLTPTASGSISLMVTFDPLLTFLSAVPTPTSVVGNTITWNQTELLGWQSSGSTMQFSIPADPGLIGTVLVTTATVSATNTDDDLSNNVATNNRTITGSYDPNDKLARTSTGASDDLYFIDEDEWIDYVIRFQNTGNDTAFNILVTDTLAAELDASTIRMGVASHPFTWELRDQGTLKFYFQNILLPDSGFSEPQSHGFVSFRIRPRLPLLPGTVIGNTANIYFDFNPAVTTEPSILTAEFSTGQEEAGTEEALQVFPNPANALVDVMADGQVMDRLELLSLDGRLLRTLPSRSSRATFDVTGLAAGMYVLRVHVLNGRIHQQLILKN